MKLSRRGAVPAALLLLQLLISPGPGAAAGTPAPPGAAAPPSAAGAPSPPASDNGRLTETTQVTVVEVPVQVVKDGEPVRGLKASDFEIVEGRQPRAITGFDTVDLAAPENQLLSADIPAAGKRHFLLLFDLANSNPKTIAKSRIAILQSLLKTLTPSDLSAVAVYSPFSGLRLIQGFTSDLRLIARAVTDLGLGLVDKHAAPGQGAAAAAEVGQALADVNSAGQSLDQPVVRTAGESNMDYDRQVIGQSMAKSLMAEAEVMLLQSAAEIAEYQHTEMAQAKSTLGPLSMAFTDMARMMAAVSGRKLVVLFSEGFDTTVLSGDENSDNQVNMATAAMYGAGSALDSDERYGSTRQSNMVESMLEQFRRSDCVIESVDISGLRGMDLDANAKVSGESSLALLAKDTGGDVYLNTNDLGHAMEALAKRTSVTYVLSFQPESLKQDGAYHSIRVRLKSAPRGTHLTYRQGYYAPLPYGQRKPMEKMLAVTDQLMGANQAGSIGAAILAEPFNTGAPLAYVPVFIELDGKTLLDGLTGKILPAEIFAYAVDATGAIRDSFNQTIQLDLQKGGALLRQGGLKYYGHLELPAGQYALRVLVRNGATGAFAKRTALIDVPKFDDSRAVLLPPLFPEVPGHWAVVHETPRGGLKDAAYPFVVGRQAYVPASRPLLRPGVESPLALVGYNLGADFKTVTAAKVESADGHDLGDCPLRVVDLVPGTGGSPDVYKALVRPPQNLAPGTYRLVVTTTGAAGPENASSLFAIGTP